jgi:riboflavin kinase/FMN adenylyltransferase
MEIVEGIENYHPDAPTCVTVGTFDGLHIGHRKMIKELVQIAESEGIRSVVITFDPHPRQVLAKGSVVRFVLTRE